MKKVLIVCLLLCLVLTAGCSVKDKVMNEVKKQVVEYIPELIGALVAFMFGLVSMVFHWLRQTIRENIHDVKIREVVDHAVNVAEKKIRDYVTALGETLEEKAKEEIKKIDFSKSLKGQVSEAMLNILNEIKSAEAKAIASEMLPGVDTAKIDEKLSTAAVSVQPAGNLNVTDIKNVHVPDFRSDFAKKKIEEWRKKHFKG